MGTPFALCACICVVVVLYLIIYPSFPSKCCSKKKNVGLTFPLRSTFHQFMHESRHLHAMRRPRGPGGRFLTAAEIAALEAQGELNNSSKSNGSQSTGGSKDGANGNSSSSHDKTPSSGRNHSNNHNGHYFPTKTAAPSQPANGFKAMPPADGQRVVSSYQA